MPAVPNDGPALRPPDRPTVAVLGLDPRGAAMASALLRTGFDVAVWAHPGDGPGAAATLVSLGAEVALGAAGAARGRDVVVLRLPDDVAVRQTLFGAPGTEAGTEPEDAVCDVIGVDTVVVDASRVSPRDSRSVARELERRGLRHLDASVSGTLRHAVEGTLATHVGGDPETMEDLRPLLEAWTAPGRLTWAGGPGSGAAARLVAAAATAVTVQTVGEMLRLGRDLDLPRAVVLEVLMQGPLGGLVGAKERRLREQDAGTTVAEASDAIEDVLAELAVALRYAASALPALEGAYLNTRLAVAAGAGTEDVVRLALAREGRAHLDDADLQPVGAVTPLDGPDGVHEDVHEVLEQVTPETG